MTFFKLNSLHLVYKQSGQAQQIYYLLLETHTPQNPFSGRRVFRAFFPRCGAPGATRDAPRSFGCWCRPGGECNPQYFLCTARQDFEVTNCMKISLRHHYISKSLRHSRLNLILLMCKNQLNQDPNNFVRCREASGWYERFVQVRQTMQIHLVTTLLHPLQLSPCSRFYTSHAADRHQAVEVKACAA